MKIIFISFFAILFFQTASAQIYETVTYKGKVTEYEMVITMNYLGNFFNGSYYVVGSNEVINIVSKKSYTDEADMVILYEYKDKGYSSYEEIMTAVSKPTDFVAFTFDDLENFSERTTIRGIWYSAEGNPLADVTYYKQ